MPLDEELRRVLPVVEALAGRRRCRFRWTRPRRRWPGACLEAGAHIINDVTALAGDPDMAEVARTAGAGVILMHMQGTPATMQLDPHYDDVVDEIAAFLATSACSNATAQADGTGADRAGPGHRLRQDSAA